MRGRKLKEQKLTREPDYIISTAEFEQWLQKEGIEYDYDADGRIRLKSPINQSIMRLRQRIMSVYKADPGFLVVVRAFDIPSAWGSMVEAVQSYGTEQKVQDYDSSSKAIYNLVVYVSRPETRPLSCDKAGFNEPMIQQYFGEYFFAPDLGENLAHSYGDRLQKPFSQFDKAAQLLKDCPWTRRSVMLIARPEDMGHQYPPCVRELQFFRPAPLYNEVWTTVFMRSWDVYGAGNPDLGSFQLAAEYVAKQIGLPTGRMTVLATNAHIYRKQLDYLQSQKADKPKTFAQHMQEVYGKK